jgi:hypothetical protein
MALFLAPIYIGLKARYLIRGNNYLYTYVNAGLNLGSLIYMNDASIGTYYAIGTGLKQGRFHLELQYNIFKSEKKTGSYLSMDSIYKSLAVNVGIGF